MYALSSTESECPNNFFLLTMNLYCGRVGGALGRHKFFCSIQSTVTSECGEYFDCVTENPPKSLSTTVLDRFV